MKRRLQKPLPCGCGSVSCCKCSGLILSLAAAALCVLLAIAAIAAQPAPQKFTGLITDSMCPTGDHSHMQMGPTDAACAIACVMIHDAEYVLYDGKHAYVLSDQKTPEQFVAQKVVVAGTLDAKTSTIHVQSMVAAK